MSASVTGRAAPLPQEAGLEAIEALARYARDTRNDLADDLLTELLAVLRQGRS